VKGELWMDADDRKRLYLIKQTVERKITQKDASTLLGLTTRQVKRICKRYKKEGDEGVLHKNRGRQSNRCIARSIKKKILELCQEKYKGFGPTLASEQLMKNEQIRISDETLRLWLIEKKLPYRKRKERPHRQWRERKKHFGEMLQMDGSHHDWLDGRGPRMVLMGYIDDATGRAFARFYEYEGTIPAFDGLARYIRRNGIPCSVYLDKHSTYKSLRKMTWADHLEGDSGESHFQRGLKELGIEVIHANSPQAKGRIERFFRTLQDRLVKEMRVVGITTLQEANKFLSKYLCEHNRKFTVAPMSSVNLHRALGKICLESVLSIQTRRFLRNDSTIFHNGKIYQIDSKLRAKYVVAQERMDGTTRLVNGKQELQFHELDRKNYLGQRKPERKEGPGKGCHKPSKPTPNHPWRQFTPKFADN
jgi:transposase